ncbi:MAG: DUF4384 domain-containing protein [Candidatus Cloacimonetes bacterium]|jgi:hypothetical protein|nr:DUF4384 domain-containing protein [Candidatus Cloacimonadota bacterium]
MVKSIAVLIAGSLILLGACTANQSQAASDGLESRESKQRSQQVFDELDGKSSGKGSSSFVPPQAMGKPTVKHTPAPKQGDLVVVEIDTCMVFNETVSLKEAENLTRNFVRELALDRALPADITLTSLITNMCMERNDSFDESVAQGIFMLSSSAGRFVKEEFLRKEPSFEAQKLRYRIHYRAHILPQQKVYNPSMALGVELSETLLNHGETFQIQIRTNSDGYLYGFDFLADNSVTLFFPTQNRSNNRIAAGQAWIQDAVAICDPDREITIETLYFVFSKDPIAGWENFRSNRNAEDLVFSAGEESFTMFQNWLAQSDPGRRVEKLAQIHILRDKAGGARR